MKPNAVAAISIESTELGQPASPARPESNVLRRVPVQLIFLLVVGFSVAFVYHAAGPWNLTAPFFGRAKDPFDDLHLDADIMWFRNPLPQFFRDGDFQIACDFFNGNPDDRNNRPNGGFNFAKSSNRTIEFYKFWYSAREKHPGLHDQDVLNLIKFDPFIDQIGLRMRFLSTVFFGGLCQPSTDFNQVCTMHANCCIGLSRKMIDLRAMLEDWRGYMALPPDLKISKRLSWSVPKNCSLAPLN